ncbi:unnamed protein product [Rotaria sordida]|uniref:Uncharacterized protein n=1 Tax=Rotaria sordida TaxID=392033 RepID=A0A814YDJ9_9BILA|nr:unnamed protein product [Rotaria sordida]CAF1172739.1 unnamed protein product [Rotaria sordida]CAF1227406.1 unnamed protein product [Rotaria sordida]CAF3845138.1 unnamed protein product [Rotaria sordida]CAF3867128.1 unnamed protein product [Rotaria sordida]
MSSRGNSKNEKNTTNDTNVSVVLRHTTELDEAIVDSGAAITRILKKNNNTDKHSAGSEAASIINESNLFSSNSNTNHTQLNVKSTVTIIDPQTKIDPYNYRSVEDTYIPSIQSTQLNKQDEITSISYCERFLNIMKENGLVCRPVRGEDGKVVLRIDGPELELIICTGVAEQDGSFGNCKCNKYYPPQFLLVGSLCHFCDHLIRFHRLKPELEPIVFDDTKS